MTPEQKCGTCTELVAKLAAEHIEGGREAQGKNRSAVEKETEQGWSYLFDF